MTVTNEIRELRMQQAAQWIKAQSESGLTKEDWCEQNGIKRWVFYKYQRLLRNHMLKTIEGSVVDRSSIVIDEEPVFIEIPAPKSDASAISLPTNNYNDYNYNNDNSQKAASAFSSNSQISISCGDFTVNVSGDANESLLTCVLRAARNA